MKGFKHLEISGYWVQKPLRPKQCSTCKHWSGDDGKYAAECTNINNYYGRTSFDFACNDHSYKEE